MSEHVLLVIDPGQGGSLVRYDFSSGEIMAWWQYIQLIGLSQYNKAVRQAKNDQSRSHVKGFEPKKFTTYGSYSSIFIPSR